MIKLKTMKDMLTALKNAGLPHARQLFNAYEKAGIIPGLTYIVDMHLTNHFEVTTMRLFTEEEIERIVEIIRKVEKK